MPDVAAKLQQARADLVEARAAQAASLPPAQRMARCHTRVQRAAEKVEKIKNQISELEKVQEELQQQLDANIQSIDEQKKRLEQAMDDQQREEQNAKSVWADTAPEEVPVSLAEFTKTSKAKIEEAKKKFADNADMLQFINDMASMVETLPERSEPPPSPVPSTTDTPIFDSEFFKTEMESLAKHVPKKELEAIQKARAAYQDQQAAAARQL
eukprot:9368402-Pyramimonas_sp.AAC.1